MSNETTLKPCPFCGGEPIMRTGVYGGFWALCERCEAQLRMSDTEAEAIATWNSRAPEAEDSAKLKAMLEANIARVRELESMLGDAANTIVRCAVNEKREAPGNAAAMREALVRLTDRMRVAVMASKAAVIENRDFDVYRDEIAADEAMLARARAALAAPARNCDVGTPEEQMRRYDEFCMSHKTFTPERVKEGKTCTACPCMGAHRCQIALGQMPYEAEGGAQ